MSHFVPLYLYVWIVSCHFWILSLLIVFWVKSRCVIGSCFSIVSTICWSTYAKHFILSANQHIELAKTPKKMCVMTPWGLYTMQLATMMQGNELLPPLEGFTQGDSNMATDYPNNSETYKRYLILLHLVLLHDCLILLHLMLCLA